MFERNILAFNTGLDNTAEQFEEFCDVREIQAKLKERGLEIEEETDADGEGASHIRLLDPDGNPVLIDQFF